MPVAKLKWVSFSHFEADECGSLAEWLAAAPQAAPLCGRIGAMLSIQDVADRPPRVLADGEQAAGEHRIAAEMRDADGRALPAGLYLLRLDAAGRTLTRRLASVR